MERRELILSLQVRVDSAIKTAITAIDCSRRLGAALVIEPDGKLLDILTDGDVRRGMLAGLSLESPVSRLLEIKSRMPRNGPVVARRGCSPEVLVQIMRENLIRQIAIVDDSGQVLDLVALHELSDERWRPVDAVVMAGGLGKRLHPLTAQTPKPMLPVQGKPLLEILVKQLSGHGIRNLHVTTHYLPEKIMDHFGDGSDFGVTMKYVQEETPLGTVGALGLIDRPDTDLLVVNGDILTQLDFEVMAEFHRSNAAAMTVAVRPHEHVVPFGVVRIENSRIIAIEEKPRQTCFVSAGVYIVSPEVFDFIQQGERQDMPDLIGRLLAAGRPVASFPVRERWLDIGQHQDYERANQETFA